MNVLVIDVGGTNVKLAVTGQDDIRKVPSGTDLTPDLMVERVTEAIKDWPFDAVTVGFPAPVLRGEIQAEPMNLAAGWLGFNFAAAFHKPVKIINDAAMQALGSYDGGRMLFMGLGTGLGTALVLDNVVAPLELAHLPYRKKRTYEDYLGERGLKRFGRKKWQLFVDDVAERFKAAFVVDYIVMGGFRLWEVDEQTQHHRFGNA
jgi:predicted NBD/HSP70 family sugar kinase